MKSTPPSPPDNPPYLVEYDGRPMLLASDLARSLGYRDHNDLARNVAGKWAAEFTEGQDFVRLTGVHLNALRALLANLGPDRPKVDDRAGSQVLLTESGAQLVAILSRTERGRAFRRWLVDVALPEWRKAHAAPSAPTPAPRRPRARRLALAPTSPPPVPVPAPLALADGMDRLLRATVRGMTLTVVEDLERADVKDAAAFATILTGALRVPKERWPELAAELLDRARR